MHRSDPTSPRLSRALLLVATVLSIAAPLPYTAAAEGERNVYYGDLHLHTSYSTDAVFLSGTRVGLDDAYRFARGEAVE